MVIINHIKPKYMLYNLIKIRMSHDPTCCTGTTGISLQNVVINNSSDYTTAVQS